MSRQHQLAMDAMTYKIAYTLPQYMKVNLYMTVYLYMNVNSYTVYVYNCSPPAHHTYTHVHKYIAHTSLVSSNLFVRTHARTHACIAYMHHLFSLFHQNAYGRRNNQRHCYYTLVCRGCAVVRGGGRLCLEELEEEKEEEQEEEMVGRMFASQILFLCA